MSEQKITIYEVIDDIRETSSDEREKGERFERAIRFYFLNDPLWSNRFSNVWMWKDAPTKKGADYGIDLVAQDAEDGSYWAIQCKCYSDGSVLDYKTVSTFFGATGITDTYKHNMLVTTNVIYSSNLEKVTKDWNTVRLNTDEIAESDMDFRPFLENTSPKNRYFYPILDHQREMIDLCIRGFEEHDRGKLTMACGTGKTFTALRLSEELCGKGAFILYLAPSIALVSQSMRSWANQALWPMSVAVVCSDKKASSTQEDVWENSLTDIPYPATTDPEDLFKQINSTNNSKGLTVIFSTYQSIQVVSDAQKMGLRDFDLIICDEAHRTTGATSVGKSTVDESEYVKVHDNSIVSSKRRLYMTATEKIYGDKVIKQARVDDYVVSSMDDESVYGPVFGHISFGRAVEEHLLSDYKVIALTVSEDAVSTAYQRAMHEESGKGFDIPEAAKIIGVWKGLANQGSFDGKPLHNAVAFCNTIAESKRICDYFMKVVNAYKETEEDEQSNLSCELQHVDGGMDAVTRKVKLDWLSRQEDNENETPTCHILSNARCLAEGVDVPSLDAVLFLQPKKSEIDIVQAVGRVMRRFEGKEYGYIILPVIIPSGMSEKEALDSSDSFAIVWKVLQALRSHDERLEARINAIPYDHNSVVKVVPAITKPTPDTDDEPVSRERHQMDLYELQRSLEDAVNAQLLKKVGTRVYWDEWAKSIAVIAQKQIERITSVVSNDSSAHTEFMKFLQGLRDSLNNSITEEAAIEMLAQHIITLPVFEALFAGDGFASSNPVSLAMNSMVNTLQDYNLNVSPDEQRELNDLYESVRIRAKAIRTDAGRQSVIKDLYEKFFSQAFKATSDSMGIVYTPNEVVSFMLHITDRLLKREFKRGLGDKDVHILDPFTGTGSYPVALLEDKDLISDEQLENKYRKELHANEIVLLAYYIASINIEHAYHSRHNGTYEPFQGGVLTDTFQMDEENDALDIDTFIDNSDRILEQQKTPIHVIISNPPWSIGQENANDNNQNQDYPTLDARISETYVARGVATLNKNSYNSYIRAFRWASDRIGTNGIITYITDGGWIDTKAMSGFRKSIADEFNYIYVFNLRGNQRTQGEQSKKEGGKIFGSGSRQPAAITVLVKNSSLSEKGIIKYYDIGEYLTREEKLSIVRNNINSISFDWETITPDEHGDWLNKRNSLWNTFIPVGLEKHKKPMGLFETYGAGVVSNRDWWVFNFSSSKVLTNISRMISNYNAESNRYYNDPNHGNDIASYVVKDPRMISWTRGLLGKAKRHDIINFDPDCLVQAMYRPFCKMYYYYNNDVNELIGKQAEFFPLHCSIENYVMAIGGINANYPFSVLMYNRIPSLNPYGGNSECLPLYWIKQTPGGAFKKHYAITDEALTVFQNEYPNCFEYDQASDTKKGIVYHHKIRSKENGGINITKEDIFFYVYGVLHSEEFRTLFSADLQKGLTRIPLVGDNNTFRAFSEAGRRLAEIHVNYESVDRWPVIEIGDIDNPGLIKKMKWGKKKDNSTNKKVNDYSVLIINENLTIKNIPEAIQNYVINGKSAIGWLIDRYQIRTDKDTGITNDPNDFSDDPRYIVDLVEKIITVSMNTLSLVSTLPKLNIRKPSAEWPEAWCIESKEDDE